MAQYEPANPSPDPSRPGYLNSHVLFRMSRQLVQSGKPLPLGVLLNIQDPDSENKIIAGGLALSERGMLSYWPPIPSRLMRPERHEAWVVDHGTLAVGTGKSHLTCYDAHDARCRPRKLKSTLAPFPRKGSAYRVWLFVAVKFDVMRAQSGFIEEWVCAPVSDKRRREQEAIKFVKTLRLRTLCVPETKAHGDFVVLELGLVDCPQTAVPRDLPPFEGLKDYVSEWKAPGLVGVNVCCIDGIHVAIRMCLPGGSIQEESLLGFPRQCAARKQ